MIFGFITLSVFIAYIPVFTAGYIWDDNHHVYLNPHLFEPGGLFRIWFTKESQQYYPLVYTSFWVEWRLWGSSPMGYHVVNVALHALNASVLFLVLSRLGFRWAWAAALVFALHPVHVESVAWVSERKNVLSGFFYLTSVLAFLAHDDRSDRKLYALSLLLFIFALLGKTVTCTLPVALLMIAWFQGRRLDARFFLKLSPFFVIGAGMGLLTAWWEVSRVGAEGAEWDMALSERLLIPGRAAWFYISKALLPLNLTFIYPRWNLDPKDFVQWIYPAAIVAMGTAFFALRNRLGRGPFAGLAFFLVSLFPALGFFNVYPFRYSFVADHFQYLASIGVIVLVVGAVAAIIKQSRLVGALITAAFSIALLVLTFNQARIYKNEETLWLDVLWKNPSAWIAHNNLGGLYAEAGRPIEAIEHFKSALKLWPEDMEARLNLAATFLATGRAEAALRIYAETLKLRPGLPKALSGLSIAALETGRVDDALGAGAEAVERAPESAEAHNAYGLALERAGMVDDAVLEYRRAIESDRGFIHAYNNLGVAFAKQGRYDEALAVLGRAVKVRPSYVEPRVNAARILMGLGRFSEAEGLLNEALLADSDSERAKAALEELRRISR